MIHEPSDDFGGLFVGGGQISRNLWHRVVVVGANGAGKTFVAQILAHQTGARVIHKDALALLTRWRQRSGAEVQAALAQAVTADRWVLEGGPSILSPPVLARATLVVWLDVPGWLRAWRILCRSLRYLGRTRPEHPAGNPDWPGLRQGRFLWRALVGGPQFRAAIEAALEGASVPVVRVSRHAEVCALMRAQMPPAEV